MKKTVLIIIALAFISLSNAQIVTIPDANFKAYLVGNSWLNTNNDSEIQVSEASAYTGAIDVSNLSIADLTGIEAFSAITTLDCQNNQLTFLNVSNLSLTTLRCFNNQLTALDVSTNTDLEELECNNNLITSLDVSANSALTYLNCKNNQLTSIHTFGNTSLETLYCENNQLNSLDISTNTALTRLRCYNNQLTTLKAQNGNNTNFVTNGFHANSNPNLTCIEVDDATWSTANWSLIDAQSYFSTNCNYTQLTYVPDNNFENYLENNGMGNGTPNDDYVLTSNIETVTVLNVFGLNISDLTGIEGFIALTELYCQNNQLTTINIANNSALEIIYCFNNQLTSLDVSSNTLLTNLNCKNNQLTALDVSTNTALSILVCSDNQIATLDLTSITSLNEVLCDYNLLSTLDLTSNLSLTRLNCNNNQLTNLALPANANLTELKCRVNQLTSLDLSANTGLTILHCQSNQLNVLNIKNGNNTNIVNIAITGNPNLTCVQVDSVTYSDNNWIIDTWTNFSENCNYSQTTYVPDDNFENYLENNGMGNGIPNDDYVNTINISGVTNLDISNLNITDLTGIEGFVALTNLFCQSNQLTSLDLTSNTTLTKVVCASNQLTNLNITANIALTELYCQSNLLTNLDLTSNSLLTSLSCDNNLLTNIDTSANTSLTIFSCQNNQLTSLDISTNTALEELYCQNNQLSSLDISTNTALEKLHCQENQLSILDVSLNTALTELKCYINQLSALDVSLNTNLIDLTCYSNQLTQLNVKNGNNTNFTGFSTHNNPVLNCIEVDNVSWSTTNWVNIDSQSYFSTNCNYSQATYVPDDNFEQALINLGYDVAPLDNYVPTINIESITSLDISNKNITDLTGIEDFVSLTELRCENNLLATLDLSQNPNLTILHCNTNLLTSLNVSQNTALTDLVCNNNQLTTLNTSQNTMLIYLICNDNLLTSLDVSTNTSLIHITCFNNQISTLDISQNNNIAYLTCANNQLTYLNVKNGNNTNFSFFDSTNNPNLTCIIVDDAFWSTTSWTSIDATSTFVNNQVACDALSVNSYNQNITFKIYPNPIKNTFKIQSNEQISKLTIYNMLGKLIKEYNAQNAYNIPNLTNGIYLIKVTTDNGVGIQRIIKTK